jgi:hypothetical protein
VHHSVILELNVPSYRAEHAQNAKLLRRKVTGGAKAHNEKIELAASN